MQWHRVNVRTDWPTTWERYDRDRAAWLAIVKVRDRYELQELPIRGAHDFGLVLGEYPDLSAAKRAAE